MLRYALVTLMAIGLVLALPGCGDDTSPDLGSLGDDCTGGDDCTSGFCNADVCSECEADGDCEQGEVCVDDTDGAGYFVCEQESLGALGDACADGAECASGFCNGDVCSECEADGDCPGGGSCVDDTGGVGYFVCEGGLADLGDACADGAECLSGFCNGGVCSECEADGDCAADETCVDDTGGMGYFVCQPDDLGALGDVCAAGADCASGFCNGNVCSECEADGDCAAGETCADDTGGVGYFVCQPGAQGDLGDACVDGAECASGFCNNDICSECEINRDCDVQQDCIFDPGAGYAMCVGTGDLGDSCDHGGQCILEFCNSGVCSECAADADCPGGGTCVDDTGGVGYFVCSGGLGADCVDAGDCNSGFCNNNICSDCLVNGDCDVQQQCDWDPGVGYYTCVGTGDLGDICDFGGQCIDGFCAGGVCSECQVDGDCGQGGVCADETGSVGYFVCLAALGGTCIDAAECASGYCFNPPGPGSWICSECQGDGDCGNQQICEMDPDVGWAVCVGDGALGDPCVGPEECASGICTGDVCSLCSVDEDCGVGGACFDGTGDVGYFYCAGGLGDPCQIGDDCTSGYCWDPFWPGDMICSECELDGDCGPQQTCEFDVGDGYAVCVGAGDLGDSCNTGDECQSLICNGGVCSECVVDDDCGQGGLCIDDTGGVGYFVCSGGLGDNCQIGADCTSGYCYDLPGPLMVCSECEDDGDCPGGTNCVVDWISFYAVCN